MKESKLRVAIISAGMITNAAHIPAYQNLKDRAELVAVCDLNPVSAEGTAQRHGIPHWYTDAETMLQECKPDLVSVCTPNASHKAMAMLALEHGCHVACEKPLALTYRDTQELFDFAREKGRVLIACQTLRYNDEYQFAREMAKEGRLGEIYYSEFSILRRRGIPKWGTFHRMDANGGGCLCDLGVHMIDAALWVMGGPKFQAISGASFAYFGNSETDIVTSLKESGAPKGVHNARPYSPEEFEVEEFAAGTIRLENGSQMNFKTSWAVNLPDEYSMRFAGSKAGLALPKMEMYSTFGRYQADILPRVFHERKYEGLDFSGHYYLMEELFDHLQNGAPLPIKPEETLNVAKIIDAFYLSARNGREVTAQEVV
ncbi:MAG TPA: Gfo/Idh/MocA family oxidoreductase [Candidatus Pullichristensenella excrementigallinarum]|uniref:Gfo/Idh/MocA family oxidoreductase n=1 Tax=Candidatus Pullichristensenella excrementigallinarum TaxID=2840907 RepID=A0A9D1IAH8_9FIRM|nr:Gfo/Idh/MocA family oxidoreductase [Candidatus Pullichristensenella excrementigallinarum]